MFQLDVSNIDKFGSIMTLEMERNVLSYTDK